MKPVTELKDAIVLSASDQIKTPIHLEDALMQINLKSVPSKARDINFL